MRIPNFRRFTPADYPSFDEDMQHFIEHLNEVLEGIITPLQGKLDFVNNFNAETKTLDVEENKTYRLRMKKLKGRVKLVLITNPEIQDFAHVAWSMYTQDEIDVQVSFDKAPTGDTEVTLLFIGD